MVGVTFEGVASGVQGAVRRWDAKVRETEMMYGPGAALRMRLDRARLAQYQRAPGLPSSFVGLDTFLGREYKVDFADFLALPADSPDMSISSVHEAFEAKLEAPARRVAPVRKV
jgi:Proteasome maturation factor UMP1